MLLQEEKVAKQQRLTYPLESLLGHWRLCFCSSPSSSKGGMALQGFMCLRLLLHRFPPAPSSSQSLGQAEIGNQIQFGSLLFKLTGPAQYLGKKNLLAFDFTHMQLSVLIVRLQWRVSWWQREGNEFLRSTHCQTPFFAFFLVTEDFIAARGRGGGLALWVKDLNISKCIFRQNTQFHPIQATSYYACWQDTGLSESMDLTLL